MIPVKLSCRYAGASSRKRLKTCWMIAALLLTNSGIFPAAFAVTALDIRFLRPEPEPLGPCSRRSGIILSEVMYHPISAPNGRNLQFIEVYNSLPWFEELGGWSIAGDIAFTFPAGFTLPSHAFVVVAADPSALSAATGLNLTNILGPFADGKSLSKSGGRILLLNNQGAVNFDLAYETSDPWPVAADGAGQSLVLARPSFGERDPRAWSASEKVGGSPGDSEPQRDLGLLSVFINEIMASPIQGQKEFVELFNYSDAAVDLSGCILTDDPKTHAYVFPGGTFIGPTGFVAVTSDQLGFGLSSKGEKLFLLRPGPGSAVDSVRYDAQSPGVSVGRFPDGAPGFRRLTQPTPNGANSRPARSPVVINEIMFHPPSDSSVDEFVELFNWTGTNVDLSQWKVTEGIKFAFPAGATLPADGFAVLVGDPASFGKKHPEIKSGSVFGPIQGSLRNSGERITLEKLETEVTTDKTGKPTVSEWYVPMDNVAYKNGGRWGRWASGGGSSLELKNPSADPWFEQNWSNSDETYSSSWTTIEATGKVDLANGNADAIEILLYGAGECLLDNVEVISVGNTNRLANGTFEIGTNGWSFQGNHSYTILETTEAFEGKNSLHLRATGTGHTGPNRLRAVLKQSVANSQTATLRAKVRWLSGSDQILLRLHGNGMEAPGSILTTSSLGTPGRKNSSYTSNLPPAITSVRHYPILPRVNAPVTVVAQVSEWTSIPSVRLVWRRDPATVTTETIMTNNGAGLFSAQIPGQSANVLVAFSISAEDTAHPEVASVFPDDAPVRECLVRWGETSPVSALGTYHLWATKATIDRWTKREKLSNDPLDTTFVYGDFRAIYNSGAEYSGSPYHAPGYSSPTSSNCDYVYVFPPDDSFLGDTEINLLQPGNGGGDGTCQQENHAYWIARELGLPFCHRRSVLVYVNGIRRGLTYDDAQQPNADFVSQWFPSNPDGDLHKIQIWFEFDPTGSTFNGFGADLNNYTSNGRKKLGRYRWNWPRRATGDGINNLTNLFSLVDACNTNVTGAPYVQALQKAVDVDEWYRTHVVEHIVNNNDSFSYGGGQNMYAYKPVNEPWKLLIWDIDFAFNNSNTSSDLFNIGGKEHGPINTEPAFRRKYWQALFAAADGPLRPERSNPILDARYQAMRTNGASVSSPSAIKTFVTKRRDYILSQYSRNDAPLQIRTNDGDAFDSLDKVVILSGTAPLALGTITLNGAPIDVKWVTATSWSYAASLQPGTNRLEISGLLPSGVAATNAPVLITANYRSNGTPPAPDILDFTHNGTSITFRWRAIPKRKYRVESTPALDSPRWTSTDITVPDATYKGSYTIPFASDGPRFFRVQNLP